jgi:hypothetical protein
MIPLLLVLLSLGLGIWSVIQIGNIKADVQSFGKEVDEALEEIYNSKADERNLLDKRLKESFDNVQQDIRKLANNASGQNDVLKQLRLRQVRHALNVISIAQGSSELAELVGLLAEKLEQVSYKIDALDQEVFQRNKVEQCFVHLPTVPFHYEIDNRESPVSVTAFNGQIESNQIITHGHKDDSYAVVEGPTETDGPVDVKSPYVG